MQSKQSMTTIDTFATKIPIKMMTKKKSKANPARRRFLAASNKQHKWSDCLDNPRNKSRTEKEGKVSATEIQSTQKKNFIQFKEEVKEEIDQSKDEESSRHSSLGELWDLEFKTKINLDVESNLGVEKKLHPITIMSVSDKLKKSLIDQCCTGHKLNDLAEALGCKFEKATKTQSYKTAAGEFQSQHKIIIKEAMLPCISTQRTFDVVLNVMHKEVSVDATYGIILGQDSMRALRIDTSVFSNSITWKDLTIPMVP